MDGDGEWIFDLDDMSGAFAFIRSRIVLRRSAYEATGVERHEFRAVVAVTPCFRLAADPGDKGAGCQCEEQGSAHAVMRSPGVRPAKKASRLSSARKPMALRVSSV